MPPTNLTETVFVVDGDLDLRESLLTLLRALQLSAQAFASGDEFLKVYRHQPGCLILDIHAPGVGGIELYRQLLEDGRKLPVIFIAAHADISTVVTAMKTGAVEFLEKPIDRQVLIDRVQSALRWDRQWRAKELEYRQLDELVRALSPTDRETLEMLLTGDTNKVMAAKRHISERAVELRRQRLMQRLKVRSLAELLELTIKHRVLTEARRIERERP